nr:nitroreductase [Rhodoferax sp.]
MTHLLPEYFAKFVADRQSVRAYLPTSVSDGVLHQILMDARRAPSGANLQPGAFILVRGDARVKLSAELTQASRGGLQEVEDYAYFPKPMPSVLKRRQVAAARALYGALGIERDNSAARDLQFERNFRFFDAPVALMVTMDHDFGSGGYMDLGMAIYGLMLSAQAHGLASCAIGALASYPGLIRRSLGLNDKTNIVCGIALGYADDAAPVNKTKTTRCELEEFFRVIG